MQELVREYLNELGKKQKKRKRINAIAAAFAVVIAGGVIWALIQSGIAMTGEPKCRIEEHTHSEDCYSDVLVCGQEEGEGHVHTDACYRMESTLICGQEESEGHTHSEECYAEERALVCGQEESKGHVHTDACYEKQLTCGKEEHIHTDVCFNDPDADVEDASLWDAQYEDVQWEEAWGANLVTAAAKQIGYKESTKNYTVAEDGSHKGYSRYGQFAGDAYADWDAAFVNFCIHYAGLEESQMFPSETAAEQWYEKFVTADEGKNKVYMSTPEGYEPEAGDIIFLKKENEETETQMGIVSSYDNEKNEIKVIEGNSGNEVKENEYSLDDSHISEYLMVTEMEKAYKSIPATGEEGNAGEEETDEAVDKTEADAQAENESWAYEESYDAGNVTIDVKAGEGVVPEGAVLSVTPIEKQEVTDEMSRKETREAEAINEQYELTEKKLQEESEKKGESLEGFLAYDICFLVDGEEVEPSGDVKVTMDFKEAMKPEGVSENAVVAVNHLKTDENAEDGVVVENLTGMEETTITTEKETASVEKVELVADSFSTFTITWYTGNTIEFSVERVKLDYSKVSNEDGNGFKAEEKLTPIQIAGEEVSNVTIDFEDIEYYQYNEIVLLEKILEKNGYVNDSNKTIVVDGITYKYGYSRIVGVDTFYNNTVVKSDKIGFNGAWYIINDYGDGIEINRLQNVKIQAVYTRTVIPSKSTKNTPITIKMIDYSHDFGCGVDYCEYPFFTGVIDGRPNQGILANKIEKNQTYPKFEKEGTYGAKESTDGKTDNGSSLKGKNLSDYFADATEVDNLFIQDEYVKNGYYYFDSAEANAVLDTESGEFTLYKELAVPSRLEGSAYEKGNFLPYNDIKKLKPSDRFSEDKVLYTPDEPINYHFGMEITTDFLQTVGGQYRGNDMIYEFTGDDDLWVYIHGVLVLDIGGIHDAKSGRINFATGEVYVQGGDFSKENAGISNADKEHTTLYRIFKSVLGEEEAEKIAWNEEKTTFADFTQHSFKMWYMERGAGASNLKVKINLPVVYDKTIQVSKEVKNSDGTPTTSTDDFKFRVMVKENGKFQPWISDSTNNRTVTLIDENGNRTPTATESDGTFTLKAGQMMSLRGFEDSTEYYVEEIGVGANYDINKTEIKGINASGAGSNKTIDGTTVKSAETSVAATKAVGFVNYQKSEEPERKTISFTKIWDDSNNRLGLRPEKLHVTLIGRADGAKEYKDEKYIEPSESEDSKWQDTWEVPAKAENGKPYTWTITEEEISGYTASELNQGTGEDYVYENMEVIKDIEIKGYGEAKKNAKDQNSPIVKSSTAVQNESYYIVNKLDLSQLNWEMKKISSSVNPETNKKPALDGAEFVLKNETGEEVGSGISVVDTGIIEWKDPNSKPIKWASLEDGTYTLTETKAPEGFLMPVGMWQVKFVKGFPVSVSGIKAEFDETSKTFSYSIENTALYSLPESGGSGIYWYMFGGILLMAGAALITYKKRCREVLKG